MKIKWVEFENTQTGLKVERVNFFDDVTLLVGLSGAGKTVILNAVDYSVRLAKNERKELRPYCVTLAMESDRKEYLWHYRIEKGTAQTDFPGIPDFSMGGKEELKIAEEWLLIDGEQFFRRDASSFVMTGYDKLPQPKRTESILSQYSEEATIQELWKDFACKYDWIVTDEDFMSYMSLPIQVLEEYLEGKRIQVLAKVCSFQEFFCMNPPFLLTRVFDVKRYWQKEYQEILSVIQDIFEEIQDIGVAKNDNTDEYELYVTIYGKKLRYTEISKGMLKTICYIFYLYTMPPESVILIDEFENGLGVNCIDAVSEIMMIERQDLQFILTSHHPKIIGSIDAANWQIIERDQSSIHAITSKDYGIKSSRHDSYFNLLNRWEYEGKI